MKWLSIKKYTPPACTNVFMRAVTTFGDSKYDRHFVGSIEDFMEIHLLSAWEIPLGYNLTDINTDNYFVTHFAIIDAVEIE